MKVPQKLKIHLPYKKVGELRNALLVGVFGNGCCSGEGEGYAVSRIFPTQLDSSGNPDTVHHSNT